MTNHTVKTRRIYRNPMFDLLLLSLQKILSKNKDGSGFLVGDKVS